MVASGDSVSNVRSLVCPNCGGQVTLRGFSHTLTVACSYCLAVLDAKTPSLRVLQKFRERERIQPLIPLGSRGKLHGDVYEVIGFQVREIQVDGVPYEWSEYLLFNPYKGFRYLTEYQGHWNDVKPMKEVPKPATKGGKRAFQYLGETYRHFQTATAGTTYVLGEFPWQARVGDRARVEDFIAPPRMLSAEITEQEYVWSIGEYMRGKQVWETFQLPGRPPRAKGIFANQPSPYGKQVKSVWQVCLALMLGLAMMLFLCSILMSQEEVFRGQFRFFPGAARESSFVTPVFELKGRPSNVKISVRTDLNNNWAYFSFALINDDSGNAHDFGKEIGYYTGRDSDGAWTEGSRNGSVTLSRIPSGRYYLRVEPEMDSGPVSTRSGVSYDLSVRRDVPSNLYFAIAAVLLLIPPVVVSLRKHSFETARWQESDYGT